MAEEAVSSASGVAGLILAGGRSSRMGSDKALLTFPGASSFTFVERLVSRLAEYCMEILLVVRDEESGRVYPFASDAHLRLVCDQVPGQGPLMGLYSGLQACSCSHALVLAVDQPFVRSELLAWLCSFPPGSESLVPRIQGVPQVLLARYARTLLPTIEECLQAGRRDPRALLTCAPVRFLEEEQVRTVDPDLRSFVNINTPQDFQRALSLL
jgi:molybdopterin-guanine dinucleotide biosynthesis protein A